MTENIKFCYIFCAKEIFLEILHFVNKISPVARGPFVLEYQSVIIDISILNYC